MPFRISLTYVKLSVSGKYFASLPFLRLLSRLGWPFATPLLPQSWWCPYSTCPMIFAFALLWEYEYMVNGYYYRWVLLGMSVLFSILGLGLECCVSASSANSCWFRAKNGLGDIHILDIVRQVEWGANPLPLILAETFTGFDRVKQRATLCLFWQFVATYK